MAPNRANERPIDQRRAFLRELENRDEVVNTDFSRNNYQVIFVEFTADSGFHRTLQDRARRLGYRIEPLAGAVYRLIQD